MGEETYVFRSFQLVDNQQFYALGIFGGVHFSQLFLKYGFGVYLLELWCWYQAFFEYFLSKVWEMIFGTRGRIIGGCVSRWMLSLVMNSKVHIQKPIGQWTFWEGMEHSTQTLPRARSGQLEGCPWSRRGFFSLFNCFGKVPKSAGSISQSKFHGQLPGVLVTYLCPYLWMLYNLTVFGRVLGMRVFAATRF